MADKKQESPLQDERSVHRVAYAPPTLKEFGAVGALTQGGAGSVAEMGMGMGMGGNPMRRP